jgi:enediyne biosynthesis protein E4
MVACNEPPDHVAGRPCAPRGPVVPWFRDATAASGVAFEFAPADFRGGPIAVADTDGDGMLDLLAGGRKGGLAHFRNQGGWSFSDDTAAVGLSLDTPVHFIAPGDLDSDGDRDVLVASDRLLLFENRGGGDFAARGELGESALTEHILLVDLDLDGLLDVYLSNRLRDDRERSRNRLLRNRGGLVLEEAAGAAGADSPGLSWTASAIDADGDGDLDVHVANDMLVADHGQPRPPAGKLPPDAFYRNEWAETGELRLTDVAAELGLDEPRSSMGGLVADFDGDRRLDLYITDFGRKKLFAATGEGFFEERGEELGVAGTRRSDGICALARNMDTKDCLLLSWGSQVGDFDLDGHEDLIVLNGVSQLGGLPPPALVLRGPPPFQEVDAGLGCFEGHGLIAADLDDDGDLDLVAGTREGPLRLFENQAVTGGAALQVALEGRRSNRDGLGAVIEVRTASGRRLVRAVGAGGVAHSSPPPRVHVGLGDDEVTDIEIRWPSGARQMAPAPGIETLVITESE